MEKFELLLKVLRDLQNAGILKHLVLVGSWCQEFYRHQYGNPAQIPATRTLDADLLIPRRLPSGAHGNITQIMENNDFVVKIDFPSGLCKFTHPQLTVEFLTDPGAKPSESIRQFKQFGISAQELRYMSIPLSYKHPISYHGLTVAVPEPEAFTLHKLIVCSLRPNPQKALKDIETAKGMLLFFSGKKHHIQRLHTIYNELPKGWRKKVDQRLLKAGMSLPDWPPISG